MAKSMFNRRRFNVLLIAGTVAILSTDAAALCTFGGPTGEPSLQEVMNDRLTAAPDAATACLADSTDAYWVASNGAAATILVEIAGFASQNTLGIYDIADPNQRIQIFSGSAGTNASRSISVTSNGSGYTYSISNGGAVWSTVFSSTTFGYYMTTPQNNIFYSDSTLNANLEDHLYAYQGNGSSFLNGPPVPRSLRGTTFDSSKYLLAWEDLLHSTGDRDYQDLVIVTQNITPVPLPAAAMLFVPGLAMLGFVRRRRSPVFTDGRRA